MSAVVTAVVVGILGQAPSAPRKKPTLAQLKEKSGIPLPDPKLPKGAVTVHVIGGPSLRPGAGLSVGLFRAVDAPDKTAPDFSRALSVQRTGPSGGVFINAALQGTTRLRLVLRESKRFHLSLPFALPPSGGVRFLFVLPKAVGAPRGTKTGAPEPGTTRDPRFLGVYVSFRVLSIESEKVFLSIEYRVVNRHPQRKRFHPGSHGLLLPIPHGMKGLKVQHGPSGTVAASRGITVRQAIPFGPRGVLVVVFGRVAFESTRLRFSLSSTLAIVGYDVRLRKYPQVRVESSCICGRGQRWDAKRERCVSGTAPGGRCVGTLASPRERMSEDGTATFLLYQTGFAGFPRSHIRFDIIGLPARSRRRSLFIGITALVLALLGLVAVMVRRRRGADPEDPLERGVDELVALRPEELLGLVSPETAAKRRDAITARARTAGGDGAQARAPAGTEARAAEQQ